MDIKEDIHEYLNDLLIDGVYGWVSREYMGMDYDEYYIGKIKSNQKPEFVIRLLIGCRKNINYGRVYFCEDVRKLRDFEIFKFPPQKYIIHNDFPIKEVEDFILNVLYDDSGLFENDQNAFILPRNL